MVKYHDSNIPSEAAHVSAVSRLYLTRVAGCRFNQAKDST